MLSPVAGNSLLVVQCDRTVNLLDHLPPRNVGGSSQHDIGQFAVYHCIRNYHEFIVVDRALNRVHVGRWSQHRCAQDLGRLNFFDELQYIFVGYAILVLVPHNGMSVPVFVSGSGVCQQTDIFGHLPDFSQSHQNQSPINCRRKVLFPLINTYHYL